jgi:hypothetical protein
VTAFPSRELAEQLVTTAWSEYDSTRTIDHVVEVSAHVSTNRVFRVVFNDSSHIVAKISSYGSYFLFAEDHDRLFTSAQLLRGTRWEGFLAGVLPHDGHAYTWYDGTYWVAFYTDVERAMQLPSILTDDQIENLAREIATFHRECSQIAGSLPATSNSVKGDAIHLLDQLSHEFAAEQFGLGHDDIEIVKRSTHEFLLHLEHIRFDEWDKIPVLVDWNLGNFSVKHQDSQFELFSRWDYDWFRIDTRMLDFYFFSRVSSETGDRTSFTYSPHTLLEPRFIKFLRQYHKVFPLTQREILFLPWAYRFFILNYVIREGAKFFREDISVKFRKDAVRIYLPMLDDFDASPLLTVLD